jgi:uncharacterized Fe-S radical SAM superfamily protein PflX
MPYVSLMGQYRPEFEVGSIAHDSSVRYAVIDRRPWPGEMEATYAVAHEAGLWRFDERA